DDVVRRALDADAEIRLRAVDTQDGDVVLAADRDFLLRFAPLAADVVEDGLFVEGAVVLQHQAAGAVIAVHGALHGRQAVDHDRRGVAAAGDVAGEAGNGRVRGRGSQQRDRQCDRYEWNFHGAAPLARIRPRPNRLGRGSLTATD